MAPSAVGISDAERLQVLRALKYPRGRYRAARASHLSSIPVRTLHDWATSATLVPDWFEAQPRGWSYRDVIFARLLAWLRSKGMERSVAAERVRYLRTLLEDAEIDPSVRSDGRIFLVGLEEADRFTGQQAFDGIFDLLDVFRLTEPIEGVSTGELWGPSLVRPSVHTFISPWVMGGEPCVVDSRVPSSSLHALQVDRGLDAQGVQRLYPFLEVEAVADALDLEDRLRAA